MWFLKLQLPGFAALSMIFVLSGSAAAQPPRAVEGLTISLGVVPAEVVAEHAPTHVDPGMHGDIPWGEDWKHVMVAVFDAQTGARVTGAEVTATVIAPDGGSVRRRLEPMVLGGTITYGEYFRMPAPGVYRIRVEVRRSDVPGTVETEFEYFARFRA